MYSNELKKPMYNFDWSEVRAETKDTVLSIEKRNSFRIEQEYNVESPTLVKTDHEWFMKYAKTSELVKLLNYDNGAVKALSFQSLLRRKDGEIYNYIINSLDEKEIIYLDLKCIGGSIGVTEYYLFLLGYPFFDKYHSIRDKEHLFTEHQIKTLDSIATTKSITFYN